MPIYDAIQNPTYQKAVRDILSITNANPMVVTTTFDGINPGDNNYESGLIVRLYIPFGFGMQQADLIGGPITVINSSSFSLPIDSTSFDPFVIPPMVEGFFYTPGQVVPIGETTDQLKQATQNVLTPTTFPLYE